MTDEAKAREAFGALVRIAKGGAMDEETVHEVDTLANTVNDDHLALMRERDEAFRLHDELDLLVVEQIAKNAEQAAEIERLRHVLRWSTLATPEQEQDDE